MFNFNALTMIPTEYLQQMLITATKADCYDIENELFRRKGDAQ
jgi:hypothetical protein